MTTTERDRLIVVEQKLDAILEKMNSFTKCTQDHEDRLRVLENKPSKRWDVVITAIITGGIGMAIGLLIDVLVKRL